ncbi:MAG TPA: C25 family cysteine peptidase, partial [Tepidisphaeraceae bacterium]|nr:C25 family cysteine peptidase [Tepidisphaeraceae bacterium]
NWSGTGITETSATLPTQLFIRGNNKIEFKVLEPRLEDLAPKKDKKTDPNAPPPLKVDMVMLDWFDLEFKQNSEIQDNFNELIFDDPQDLAGARAFSVRNFSSPRVLLFDLAARECLQPKSFPQVPGSRLYAVNLERRARPTTLVAATDAMAFTPPEMRQVTIQNLFGEKTDCDMLMLSHPLFLDSLKPFIQWKESHGIKTHLVSITDLFNEKTGGYASPYPMRDYIRYIYNRQRRALKYVLLVGDSATISKYQSFCPAYAYLQSGTHANDNFYANFNDPLGPPILSVGRFSVRTPEQVANITRKVVGYESGQFSGPWRSQFLIIAAAYQWAKDDARSFIKKYVQPDYLASFIRTDYWNEDPEFHKKLTQRLVDEFNAGRGVTVFFGHGGGTVWEVGPSIRKDTFRVHLFDQSNVQSLTNVTKPGVVFAMTCYTNDFDNPYTRQTVGEMFVNSPGGAVASFGATGRSSIALNAALVNQIFALRTKMKDARLGDLIAEAKRTANNFKDPGS